ncbi:cyclic nucleotide-binding domain-containing protein [Marinihelvus fidelis]|uniref:Cyclic nucleotide-binding domain-containing protein n=2 Tax=Marinihelvus fidelis TaxID=2613842 RepID=A0A5N0T4B2_9GAMM|nr:cyclic nucleotide-binding domain-containing protein [Marinihelvus fidelis]
MMMSYSMTSRGVSLSDMRLCVVVCGAPIISTKLIYTETGISTRRRRAARGTITMDLLNYFSDWDDVVEFKKKSQLFHELDEADYMFVILSGEVEVTLRGEPLGAEIEGGVIGEMALINNARRSATAVALKKTRVARVDRENFRRIVRDNPDFALHIMAVMANRLRVADQIIAG